MSIALVADRGSAQNNTAENSTAVTLTAGASVAIGNYLVARIALDNAGASGAAPVLTISDPDNTWTITTAANQDPGAASAGATCYIAYTRVIGAYNNNDNVTFQYDVSVTAKAIVVEEWSGLHKSVPLEVAATTAVGATGTPSIARTPTGPNRLVYTALAIEGLSADTYTQDSDTTNGSWISLTSLQGGSGTAATSMTVRGAYKLVTAAGAQSWDPTITARDWAALALVFDLEPDRVAGPWGQPAPGWVSPTGQLTAIRGDIAVSNDLSVNVPAEAAAAGTASDAVVDIGTAADQTTAAGISSDATLDAGVNADIASATSAGSDAATLIAEPTGGPWTAPTPGRLGPTGQLTTVIGDATPAPNLLVNVPAEAAASGAANDAALDVAVSAEIAAGTGTGFDAAPDASVSGDTTSATATGFDAASDVAVSGDTTGATGTGFDATTDLPAVAETNIAGPWASFAPGWVSPTGQLTAIRGEAPASSDLSVNVPSEAAGTGAAFDAAPDVAVNAETTTATGTAFDAVVSTAVDQPYAGPWTSITPGWLSPTGQFNQQPGIDTVSGSDLSVNVSAEAAASGAAHDAAVDIGLAADTTSGAGTASNPGVDLGPAADATSASGIGFDGAADAGVGADQTAASGAASDAASDVQINADAATAAGPAFDAQIDTGQQVAGPYLWPTPGHVGPTGRWTVFQSEAPPVAVTPTADVSNATGTAYDASVAIGPAADVATASAIVNDAAINLATVAGLAMATGVSFDAVLALAVAVEAAYAAGTAFAAQGPQAAPVDLPQVGIDGSTVVSSVDGFSYAGSLDGGSTASSLG